MERPLMGFFSSQCKSGEGNALISASLTSLRQSADDHPITTFSGVIGSS